MPASMAKMSRNAISPSTRPTSPAACYREGHGLGEALRQLTLWMRSRTSVPDSEVRKRSRRPLSELRNRKGHLHLYDSSAAFEPEVRKHTRREHRTNFGFA